MVTTPKIWTVVFANSKARKAADKLPTTAKEDLALLIGELASEGPIQPEWPHYGKLHRAKGQPKNVDRYHCHIGTGKTAYVAIWNYERGTLTLEVSHAGTHEEANRKYRKF